MITPRVYRSPLHACIVLIASVNLLPLGAQGSVDADCEQIERTFAANEPDLLRALDPQQPRWQTLQQFRLTALYIQEDQPALARKAIRHGLQVVARGLKAQPDDVELLIIGAMLDGEHVLTHRWSFFFNGIRGVRRLRRAEALDPANPRAALVRGVAKIVLPWVLGGRIDEAIEILELADRTTQTCDNGDWSQVDTWMWLGRAHDKKGDQARAEEFYRRALARSPDNHWIKVALAGEGYEWKQEQ